MKLDRIANVADARRAAKRTLPGVVFDYIDGAADDEVTMRANVASFDDVVFRPRMGMAASDPDPRDDRARVSHLHAGDTRARRAGAAHASRRPSRSRPGRSQPRHPVRAQHGCRLPHHRDRARRTRHRVVPALLRRRPARRRTSSSPARSRPGSTSSW